MIKLTAICAALALALPAEAATRQLTNAERMIVEGSVKPHLKDPWSARFQWPPVHLVRRSDGITDYCFAVNSRNGFGAYAGTARVYAQLVFDKSWHLTVAETRMIGEGGYYDSNVIAVAQICAERGY